MTHLAIFASGTGSNAHRIIEHFRNHDSVRVALVVSNRKAAGVLPMAESHDIPTAYVPKTEWKSPERVLGLLEAFEVDFIALAGFLLLVPEYLVEAFPQRIVNIHPALLPKFGGKGMYGTNVHRAVEEAKETESGITIHYVNARYDEGNVIFQATTPLAADDSVEEIGRKVLVLEHRHYPEVLEKLLSESMP